MSGGCDWKWPVGAGLLMGGAAALLAWLGNPVNTGICISCFLENSVGALGLHGESRMWYARPELTGFFLGSFLSALLRGEFRSRQGGSGLGGLGLGIMMIVGSAVFIGCPIKAFLRLAGGDMTAWAGIAGLVFGVWVGIRALGDSDLGLGGKRRDGPAAVPWGLVAVVAVVAALPFVPGVLKESARGPGSMHAPAWISLLAGLLVGAACQGSRFCVTGQVRDVILTKSASSGYGLLAFILAALAVNAATGAVSLAYSDAPGVHLEWWWSFGGMALTGWAAVLAGGCPFRQIVKAGEGDLDAATIAVGMVVGAVLVEAWGLGSTSAGTTPQGRMAVLLGFSGLIGLSMAWQGRVRA